MNEAQAAADVIGARFHFAGGEDLAVTYNDNYRRLAVQMMRVANPTIVFTPPPMNYLVDHEETSRLVRNAAFIGPVPNYDCGTPTTVTSRSPHLYYANAIGGRDLFGRPLPLTGADGKSAADHGQVCRSTDQIPESPARVASFTVFTDDQWHEQELDLAKSPRWRGRITRLRFDPCEEAGKKVELDWLRLSP